MGDFRGDRTRGLLTAINCKDFICSDGQVNHLNVTARYSLCEPQEE